MKTTAITVLMPVYNAEPYLREAIESVLNQTFTDFEFLIINDGSTDKSEEIILSYTDKRIRYIKNATNLKLIAALNKGIELAKGKYIARMDADDISLPDRLEKQFNFMEQNSEIALCGSWFQSFGETNKIVKYVGEHNQIMMKMLYQCHFCHPSIIMRKSIIEEFPIKFDPIFLHAEDYDFFTRIGEKFKLANIPEVLLKYRLYQESVSAQNKKTQDANSVIVKKRLFEKIGFHINENELFLYRKIGQYEYQRTSEFLNQSQVLLEKIVVANDLTNFIEKKFVRSYIAQLWYNVAYNLTPLGTYSFQKYFASVLSSTLPLSFFQRSKFQFKAFFKI